MLVRQSFQFVFYKNWRLLTLCGQFVEFWHKGVASADCAVFYLIYLPEFFGTETTFLPIALVFPATRLWQKWVSQHVCSICCRMWLSYRWLYIFCECCRFSAERVSYGNSGKEWYMYLEVMLCLLVAGLCSRVFSSHIYKLDVFDGKPQIGKCILFCRDLVTVWSWTMTIWPQNVVHLAVGCIVQLMICKISVGLERYHHCCWYHSTPNWPIPSPDTNTDTSLLAVIWWASVHSFT